MITGQQSWKKPVWHQFKNPVSLHCVLTNPPEVWVVSLRCHGYGCVAMVTLLQATTVWPSDEKCEAAKCFINNLRETTETRGETLQSVCRARPHLLRWIYRRHISEHSEAVTVQQDSETPAGGRVEIRLISVSLWAEADSSVDFFHSEAQIPDEFLQVVFLRNSWDSWLIISVTFQPNIPQFQLLKCEDVMFFVIVIVNGIS